jgi:hypothetical protein
MGVSLQFQDERMNSRNMVIDERPMVKMAQEVIDPLIQKRINPFRGIRALGNRP